MVPSRPQIYVAGPLGFTEPGRRYHAEVLLPALEAAGFDPLDPWALDADIAAVFSLTPDDPERAALLPAVNRAVGAGNAEMIRTAAALLAVLDGSDVDSGTAAEIGYASALSRPVIGLRTDLRPSGDNEATLVNLQVEWFVEASGGAIYTSLDDAIAALVRIIRN